MRPTLDLAAVLQCFAGQIPGLSTAVTPTGLHYEKSLIPPATGLPTSAQPSVSSSVSVYPSREIKVPVSRLVYLTTRKMRDEKRRRGMDMRSEFLENRLEWRVRRAALGLPPLEVPVRKVESNGMKEEPGSGKWERLHVERARELRWWLGSRCQQMREEKRKRKRDSVEADDAEREGKRTKTAAGSSAQPATPFRIPGLTLIHAA